MRAVPPKGSFSLRTVANICEANFQIRVLVRALSRRSFSEPTSRFTEAHFQPHKTNHNEVTHTWKYEEKL